MTRTYSTVTLAVSAPSERWERQGQTSRASTDALGIPGEEPKRIIHLR
jgi:hypothetical protein